MQKISTLHGRENSNTMPRETSMAFSNVRGMYEPVCALQTNHEPIHRIRARFSQHNNGMALDEPLQSHNFAQCSLR